MAPTLLAGVFERILQLCFIFFISKPEHLRFNYLEKGGREVCLLKKVPQASKHFNISSWQSARCQTKCCFPPGIWQVAFPKFTHWSESWCSTAYFFFFFFCLLSYYFIEARQKTSFHVTKDKIYPWIFGDFNVPFFYPYLLRGLFFYTFRWRNLTLARGRNACTDRCKMSYLEPHW